LFEERVLLDESFEETLDLFKLFEVLLGVDFVEGEIFSLVLEESDDGGVFEALGLDAVEVVKSFGLI
jgi:hypothetical protein